MAKRATLLLDGLYFGEGPRWHEGELWFSDFYDHAVKAVTPSGSVRTVVELPGGGQPSGLGWLPDGRLLLVSMLDRKLLRLEPGGLVDHADLSGVATFHCNDMVVDATGRAYVGNFGFDLDAELAARGMQSVLEDHVAAKLARVDPDGSVHVVASDMHFPNGSVITPDGRTLIVAETFGLRLTAFTIADDGSLHDRRVWADLGFRVPDGICLDADGNVWVANPLSPECFLVAEDPNGADIIDVVETDHPCYACMLGGEDRTTLFMLTAATSEGASAAAARTGHVVTAAVEVPGAGWP
ncbi:MAG: SMP-30/gluconolactonase/LRE family protein [Acidimicrobiia bacterium]